MKQPISFSIIIPTYNRAYSLQRAIESVVSQTYSNWEIIIVDNCSTDSTDEIVDSYKSLPIFFIKNNIRGPASSRNIGIHASNHEYLAFLDSDDYWHPLKLELTKKAILENDSNVIYHDLRVFYADKNGKLVYINKLRSRTLKSDYFHDLFYNGNTINTSSLVIKKSLLPCLSMFDSSPSVRGVEDYLAWLECLRVNSNSVHPEYLKKCLGYYELSSDSISSLENRISSYKYIIDYYSIHNKIIPSHLIPAHLYSHLAICHFKLKNYKFSLSCSLKAIQMPFHYEFSFKALIIILLASLFILLSSIKSQLLGWL